MSAAPKPSPAGAAGAATASTTTGVPSPCINVCRLDAASGLCQGCFRTLDEIAGWSRASDDARRRILAAVDQRRAEHEPWGEACRGEGGKSVATKVATEVATERALKRRPA